MPANPSPPDQKPTNSPQCLFAERDVALARDALLARAEHCANLLRGVDPDCGENASLGNLLKAAEEAMAAAESAERLAANCRYLAGFLMGAGVPLR